MQSKRLSIFLKRPYIMSLYKYYIDMASILTSEAGKTASSQKVRRVQA